VLFRSALFITKAPQGDGAKMAYAWSNTRWGEGKYVMAGNFKVDGDDVTFYGSSGNLTIFFNIKKGEGMVVFNGARDSVRTRFLKVQ
jgi:hypothetical protein